MDERTTLIASIFSDREEVEVIKSFPGDDAQSFINIIDEVSYYAISRSETDNKRVDFDENIHTFVN